MTNFLFLSSALLLLFTHCFMVSDAMNLRNLTTDQDALLEFKNRILDSHNILANNWTTTTSVCNWVGVSCAAKHRRVRALNLPNMDLTGTISPHLGNLSFLVSLNLSYNFLTGEIPSGLGRLNKVLYLSLQNNNLTGAIPQSLFNMSKLEILDLRHNLIQGHIPHEINNLLNLRILRLAFNQLSSSLPLAIYNISSLHMISLASNNLYGSLPKAVCRHLPNLEALYLAFNDFSGLLPSSIDECSNLRDIDIYSNRFQGSIPRSIGNLTTLKLLYLGVNNLQGEIPSEIGNLISLEILDASFMRLHGLIPPSIFNISSLREIHLQSNSLSGEIPWEIGNLISLEILDASFMHLNGLIPPPIFNISSLKEVHLQSNSLSGKLPETHSVSNLEKLHLWGNNLSGNIPDSICNASNLRVVELEQNSFSGLVPNTLGNLRFLEKLLLWSNHLTTKTSTHEWSFLYSLASCRRLIVLDLSSNPLNGILPPSISNLSTSLQYLLIKDCKIRGSIPMQIGSLNNVIWLDLSSNELSGRIPTIIGRLKSLQLLNLYGNKLQGSIPHELCGLKRLYELSLGANELDGHLPTCFCDLTSMRKLYLFSNRLHSTIPSTFWSLKDILVVDLSANNLSGLLPLEIANLKVLTYLNLSRNLLSSDIPSTIGSLHDLQVLSLSTNRFEGPIPRSFGDLMSLTSLDLSNNNLSGIIPKSLERLSDLNYFDVSFNRLEGEIPSGGSFLNFTVKSFMKNYALCGPSRLQVPPCKNSFRQKSKKTLLNVLRYALPAFASIIVVVAFIIVCKMWRRRSKNLPVVEDLIPLKNLKRVSYNQLLEGTDGFNENNLLGFGSFGSVYKGKLLDGEDVAIKVFDLQVNGALRSFDVECEVMSNTVHRNLVKVITCCSTINFKALVLAFMPNGSLEKWLYSYNHSLDILQRINIMIDVASAIEYLHFGHPIPVIHCDLKPSNVLLDKDMVAHVGDFGIAKLLGEDEPIKQTMTLATIGYMAPEYGSAGIISVKSDVYSYGILLMETFTRKKPTDEIFSGDMSLKHWVERSFSNEIIGVADSSLVQKDDQYFVIKANCISSIMGLALDCSAELPENRLDMKNVVAMLKTIKRKYLNNIPQG